MDRQERRNLATYDVVGKLSYVRQPDTAPVVTGVARRRRAEWRIEVIGTGG